MTLTTSRLRLALALVAFAAAAALLTARFVTGNANFDGGLILAVLLIGVGAFVIAEERR